ncbi:hypothetical protein [Halomonas sp. 328]|uniref:hypothetical protein n=1 Tax=Halomonas sp. 328 TaxID=2776704 RepID=UPI001E4053CF|nr:hypothetical protein [Halomonas sp. 328]
MKREIQNEINFQDGDVDVVEVVKICVAQLIDNDFFILESDLNERTISSQLSRYLQISFSEWHVDCEYNRDHDDPKRLKVRAQGLVREELSRDTIGRTVFPDIIVHERGRSRNFIVIEIKKTTSAVDRGFDVKKLHAFKSQLGYQYAIFLEIGTGNSAGCYELICIE